jgi:single-strand DNA-binding protein
VFDTNIVIVGNVLTAPEWRRTSGNALVSNFRVASTARRFDRDSGRWVDGNHLRVRVSCWRRLAEGVGASIAVGDPVVVAGRLYTRDWTDDDGNPRTSFELEAVAVGHDLARGKAKFFRNRPTTDTSEVRGSGVTGQVRGEPAELLSEQEVPAAYGEGIPDEEEPIFVEDRPADPDPMTTLMGRPGTPSSATGDNPGDGPVDNPDDGPGDEAGDDLSPVEGEPADDGPQIEVEAVGAEPPARRRSRRTTKREPVPA